MQISTYIRMSTHLFRICIHIEQENFKTIWQEVYAENGPSNCTVVPLYL